MPRRFTLALSVACAAAWVLALLPRVDPAYAASFTVATAADAPHSSPVDGTCASQLPGNPCTLRAAIEAANFLGGGTHRIEILPGTYQLTAGALPIDASALLVSANGNTGEPSVVVDGNGTDRVLDIGRRAVAEVVLVGLVVQNGNPGPAADGGAVQVHTGSMLRMTNGAVLNSRAANGGGIGSDGTVRLINTEVSNNVATGDGGGILSRGSLTLVNGGARNNAAAAGGGIVNDGELTITNADLTGNTASGDGGGILNRAGVVTFTNGGAQENRAANGGGIVNDGTLTLSNANVTGNAATRDGGGILSRGTQSLTNVEVSGNTAEGIGGGILTRAGVTTLSNGAIKGNSAAMGGGVATEQGATATLVNADVTENTAQAEGGGLYSSASALDIAIATIAANTAGGNGGGIAALGGALSLSRATVSTNSAAGDGGGIYGDSATMDVTNATISGNSAAGGGAGVLNRGGTARLTSVTLAANTTAFPSGGALAKLASGVSTLQSTLLANGAPAGNCAALGPRADQGTLRSAGGNFSSDRTCAEAFRLPGEVNNRDPLVGPLQDNGGPTQTQALMPGSPAVGAVSAALCFPLLVDQRGVSRSPGARCDVGAYQTGP
jgi:CSLREA domain-containing protein